MPFFGSISGMQKNLDNYSVMYFLRRYYWERCCSFRILEKLKVLREFCETNGSIHASSAGSWLVRTLSGPSSPLISGDINAAWIMLIVQTEA